MHAMNATSTLNWVGPFSFLFHGSEVSPDMLDQCGLYILAIRYHGKYYCYNPGITAGPGQSFAKRLGYKLAEYLKGTCYVHDPLDTLRTGRLSRAVDVPPTPGFDREKAGREWAWTLDVFLVPSSLDRPRIEETERAIHRHFKWLHRRGSVFARMYDEQQEPQSGPGPDCGDDPVCSVFQCAVIEGLTTVRVSAAP